MCMDHLRTQILLKSQVIPALCRKAIEKKMKELVVWGSGKQKRAFAHVDDVVNGFIKAINKT